MDDNKNIGEGSTDADLENSEKSTETAPEPEQNEPSVSPSAEEAPKEPEISDTPVSDASSPPTTEETAPEPEQNEPSVSPSATGGTDSQNTDAKPSAANAEWYIAHVYSGFEKKAADSIKEQAKQKGIEDAFEEMLIPTQDVVELRRGKKVNLEKKVFPGYVLLKMRMDDETWHLVNNTAKVTGFLGGGNGVAAPISQDEVNQIVNQTKVGKEKAGSSITFEVGEQVRVCDGPFNSFNGLVEEVDEEKSRLKVSVSILSLIHISEPTRPERIGDCVLGV